VVKEGPGDRLLCRKGKILTLSSHEAIECGLAAGEADDIDELGGDLKLSGWAECRGLGTLLADYLPRKNEVLKAESTRIMSRFQQDLQQAVQSDPAEVVSRVVTTGPRVYRPMPGRMMIPPRPGFQPGGQTTVVTTVSKLHWKARSLACVVALQHAEADLADEKALCEDFGQRGAAELFNDSMQQLGALRARIYGDRNKYGPGSDAPVTAPAGPAGVAQNGRDGPPFYANRLPAGATETDLLGGRGGGRFIHVSPASAPVLGFRYSSGNWMNKSVLRDLDPLYQRTDHDAPADVAMARDGYVVGGLTVESDGKNVVAVQVIFSRFKDGRIDPADHYKSEWLGVSRGGETQDLGGKDAVVIGTYGRKGLFLDALGLVLGPPSANGK
jgi:hypothetical protein